MVNFLSIQHTYEHVEIALFAQDTLCEQITIDKTTASKDILSRLASLLHNNSCTLSNIAFIAVNQGPGPFTTLRVVIATVNGISFATGIPLIGVDGLDALLDEGIHSSFTLNVALLNAFNNDVYFGIARTHESAYEKECSNIDALLARLQTEYPATPIHFFGQGASLFAEHIKNIFGEHAHLDYNAPATSSVKQIGLIGLEKWKQHVGLTQQLLPLYLKTQNFSKSK